MFTFKEALCLMAVAVAYGVAGRIDCKDASPQDPARQHAAAACATLPPAEGPVPGLRSTHPPGRAHPLEVARAGEACATVVNRARH